MAHDIGIAGKFFNFVVRKHGTTGDVKIVEGSLKTRPFGRDNPPDETGSKDAGGHLGQYIGVADSAQVSGVPVGANSCSSSRSPPLRAAARA